MHCPDVLVLDTVKLIIPEGFLIASPSETAFVDLAVCSGDAAVDEVAAVIGDGILRCLLPPGCKQNRK